MSTCILALDSGAYFSWGPLEKSVGHPWPDAPQNAEIFLQNNKEKKLTKKQMFSCFNRKIRDKVKYPRTFLKFSIL